MSIVGSVALTPAVLGGSPAFPDGLPLVRPHLPDRDATLRELDAVLASGILTNGPRVRELEERAAEYLGVRHVVAVASCTSGLMLALSAFDLRGGRVLMPSFTFSATAHAAHWAGGRPAFVDIDPSRLTVDPTEVETHVDDAAAIVATHVYGTPCEVGPLEATAGEAGVPLLFDAAHALGSRHRGQPVGRFGSAEVFSLSPTKVVVAGEGGLVATDDEALAEHCRLGRDYGNPGDYDCRFPGLNARMSELHATVALTSLAAIDRTVEHRNVLAGRFCERLAAVPGVSFPQLGSGDTSTIKDLTMIVDPDRFGMDTVQLARALAAEGIDSRRYYAPPVHRQEAYHGDEPLPSLPVTDRISRQVLSTPLWSAMSVHMIEQVADTVARIQTHAADVVVALR